MASQAEVDLVVNATRTLPELERDLDRVLTAAQADLSDLDVAAVLNQTATLNQLDRDLDRVIAAAAAGADDIDVTAALNQQDAIRRVRGDLDRLVNQVDAGGTVDPVLITAALNGPASLRRIRGELTDVIRTAEVTAPEIDVDVDTDSLNLFRRALSDANAVLIPLGKNIGLLGAAAGTAAPLLAGVVTSVQNLIPAAAVATTGLLAMTLATQTLKLGFLGVGEAITEAFKPDADQEKVKEALDQLAPSARAAATEIIALKGTFRNLQLGVQQRLFQGFDQAVRALSTTALPLVRGALNDTAQTLNAMGLSVAQAAVQLSGDGTLGTALDSATKGLDNLKGVPAQVAMAFTQLAAAAGPSFERLTKSAASAADRIAERLGKAFESGGLQDAIEQAIDAVAQLGRIGGNVFGALGNIIKAVSSNGDGLFGTLEQLTQGFEDITGTKTFQDALSGLADVMGNLYTTVGPLLATAFEVIGQVLIKLTEPANQLIDVLGDSLTTIFDALGPVLVGLADAFGKLVVALLPIITLGAQLIAGILPVLVPQFKAFGDVFVAATPFIQQFTDLLASLLLPLLAELPGLVALILPPFVQLAQELFPQLAEMLVILAPYFATLGEQLAELAVEAGPLIAQILELALSLSEKLVPVIAGIVTLALIGLTTLLTGLAAIFRNVVLPAIKIIVAALNGDFFDSTSSASKAVQDLKNRVSGYFIDLKNSVSNTLSGYVDSLRTRVREGSDSFLNGLRDMVNRAVAYVQSLPGRIRGALGPVGRILFDAGASIISGFIDGIQSKIGSLSSVLSGITNLIPDLKGPADVDRKLLTPAGEMVMEGFIKGVRNVIPDVRSEFQGLTGAIPGFAPSISQVSAPNINSALNPTILVTIGNEAVDQYVTTRVEAAGRRSSRIAAQGVRL